MTSKIWAVPEADTSIVNHYNAIMKQT